jgi:hypothetical protein
MSKADPNDCGYAESVFSLEPLARSGLASRFCVLDCADANQRKIDVLVKKTQAHEITNHVMAMDAEWSLVFDMANGPFVIIEIRAGRSKIEILSRALSQAGFKRMRVTADQMIGRPRLL